MSATSGQDAPRRVAVVAGLAKALHERGSGRGAISICAAAGQGVVAVLESAAGGDR